jgi:hypothetical protein
VKGQNGDPKVNEMFAGRKEKIGLNGNFNDLELETTNYVVNPSVKGI